MAIEPILMRFDTSQWRGQHSFPWLLQAKINEALSFRSDAVERVCRNTFWPFLSVCVSLYTASSRCWIEDASGPVLELLPGWMAEKASQLAHVAFDCTSLMRRLPSMSWALKLRWIFRALILVIRQVKGCRLPLVCFLASVFGLPLSQAWLTSGIPATFILLRVRHWEISCHVVFHTELALIFAQLPLH